MNSTYTVLIIVPIMLIMMCFFFIIFGIILTYLISVYKLIQITKEHDIELWDSLGKPSFFPFLHSSCNPFQGFIAQIKVSNWILKNNKEIKNDAILLAYKKAKKLFNISIIGLVSLFFIYILFFIGIFLFLGNK